MFSANLGFAQKRYSIGFAAKESAAAEYIPEMTYRTMAGPPVVGFGFIAAGFLVAVLQLIGVLGLLSCNGGVLVLTGLFLLLIGTGTGLLVHPTVPVVADVLGTLALIIGIVSTGSGHC